MGNKGSTASVSSKKKGKEPSNPKEMDVVAMESETNSFAKDKDDTPSESAANETPSENNLIESINEGTGSAVESEKSGDVGTSPTVSAGDSPATSPLATVEFSSPSIPMGIASLEDNSVPAHSSPISPPSPIGESVTSSLEGNSNDLKLMPSSPNSESKPSLTKISSSSDIVKQKSLSDLSGKEEEEERTVVPSPPKSSSRSLSPKKSLSPKLSSSSLLKSSASSLNDILSPIVDETTQPAAAPTVVRPLSASSYDTLEIRSTSAKNVKQELQALRDSCVVENEEKSQEEVPMKVETPFRRERLSPSRVPAPISTLPPGEIRISLLPIDTEKEPKGRSTSNPTRRGRYDEPTLSSKHRMAMSLAQAQLHAQQQQQASLLASTSPSSNFPISLSVAAARAREQNPRAYDTSHSLSTTAPANFGSPSSQTSQDVARHREAVYSPNTSSNSSVNAPLDFHDSPSFQNRSRVVEEALSATSPERHAPPSAPVEPPMQYHGLLLQRSRAEAALQQQQEESRALALRATAAEEQLEFYRSELARLKKLKDSLTTRNNKLTVSLEGQRSAAAEQARQSADLISQHELAAQQAQSELDSLRALLHRRDGTIGELQAQLEQIRAKEVQSRLERDRATLEVQQLQLQTQQLQKQQAQKPDRLLFELDSLRSERNSMLADLRTVEADFFASREENAQLREELAHLREELKAVRSEKARSDTALAETNERFTRIRDDLRLAERRTEALVRFVRGNFEAPSPRGRSNDAFSPQQSQSQQPYLNYGQVSRGSMRFDGEPASLATPRSRGGGNAAQEAQRLFGELGLQPLNLPLAAPRRETDSVSSQRPQLLAPAGMAASSQLLQTPQNTARRAEEKRRKEKERDSELDKEKNPPPISSPPSSANDAIMAQLEALTKQIALLQAANPPNHAQALVEPPAIVESPISTVELAANTEVASVEPEPDLNADIGIEQSIADSTTATTARPTQADMKKPMKKEELKKTAAPKEVKEKPLKANTNSSSATSTPAPSSPAAASGTGSVSSSPRAAISTPSIAVSKSGTSLSSSPAAASPEVEQSINDTEVVEKKTPKKKAM